VGCGKRALTYRASDDAGVEPVLSQAKQAPAVAISHAEAVASFTAAAASSLRASCESTTSAQMQRANFTANMGPVNYDSSTPPRARSQPCLSCAR
jgi:hypothetical protein